MIDSSDLGLLALVIRLFGTIFFTMVLAKQVKLRLSRYNDDLNHFRDLLIILTMIPFAFNFLSIYNNFVRFSEGHQNEVINNISFVAGALASTATAITLWLIYRDTRNK